MKIVVFGDNIKVNDTLEMLQYILTFIKPQEQKIPSSND